MLSLMRISLKVVHQYTYLIMADNEEMNLRYNLSFTQVGKRFSFHGVPNVFKCFLMFTGKSGVQVDSGNNCSVRFSIVLLKYIKSFSEKGEKKDVI